MQRRRSTRAVNYVTQEASAVVPEPPAKKQKVVNKLNHEPVIKTEKNPPFPGPNYVSPYEAAIKKNIEERMAMLKMLQIDAIKEEVKSDMAKTKPKVKPNKRVPVPVDPTPSRQSLRIRGCDTSGKRLPARAVTPPPEPLPRIRGTQWAGDASTGLTSAEDAESLLTDIFSRLAREAAPGADAGGWRSLALTELAITDDAWMKVTPQSAASMAFCPLQQKHVLAVGDISGVLGLWDVALGDVHNFFAHRSHIGCVSFSPVDGGRCYTSSDDGVCRVLDLERAQFQEVYATPQEVYGRTRGGTQAAPELSLHHHAHAGERSLLLGRSDGHLVRCDGRARDVTELRLSDTGGLRFLSVHPSREHCLAVVERPSTISLWDLRQVKGPRSALQRLTLLRACASVAISRHTGDHLVAPCVDDTIRLYDGINEGRLNPARTIPHCNQTGRWLSSFKPAWLPESDDLFVVGSLRPSPRRLEVYDRDGRVHHLLMGPPLRSVCPIIACHPSEPAIAGATVAGKVYLFK